MTNIYFSADIETNGLIAGLNSMISLGCAAIDLDNNEIVGEFKVNIEPVEGLSVDQATMNWWKLYPDAYRRATENAIDPLGAMREFSKWVEQYNIQHPVLAAWKPAFDVAFIRYYTNRFLGKDLFGRSGSGLDIKTLTAAALDWPYSETQIGKVPEEFKYPTVGEHNHDALDDAIEQAHVLYWARKRLGVIV